MSEDTANVDAPAMPKSGELILTLGGIAMVSGLLVVLAFQLTKPIITQNKREKLEQAVFKVLPGATSRVNFLLDAWGMKPLPDEDFAAANVFAGYDDAGKLVGVAIEASARGYQDVVTILYGYSIERECIIGITVLQSTETPGLGDRVQTDLAFLANFNNLDAQLNDDKTAMRNQIVTVKHGKKTEAWQIDAIAGATITSTAIGKALRSCTNKMLPSLVKYKAVLFTKPDTSEKTKTEGTR